LKPESEAEQALKKANAEMLAKKKKEQEELAEKLKKQNEERKLRK
jgi:hypothetical protein